MDITIIGLIIIGILIFMAICIHLYLYWYSNPKPLVSTLNVSSLNSSSLNVPSLPNPSVVTCSYLGRRGDMGNQMFQLATTYAAARRSDAKIVIPSIFDSLPISNLFDLFEIKRKDVIPNRTYYEYDNYENILIPTDGKIYDIRGYRQAYNYFDDYSSEIRKLFLPNSHIINTLKSILPSQYIAIHIRRGDYIKKIHSIPLLREFKRCQLQFYIEGIAHLRRSYPSLPLLVCTDSPEWVQSILSELDFNAVLAPIHSDINPKFSDFCVLYLATALVISNSTYSWWAAYLRENREVICPTPWWDPDGFIGTGMGLNGSYLHYPKWTLLDADTGAPVARIHSDTNDDTLNMYRLIRGYLL